jgi:hypothetical protein
VGNYVLLGGRADLLRSDREQKSFAKIHVVKKLVNSHHLPAMTRFRDVDMYIFIQAEFFEVFLCPSRQNQESNLQLGHASFFLHPFKFTIHYHPIIRRYTA